MFWWILNLTAWKWWILQILYMNYGSHKMRRSYCHGGFTIPLCAQVLYIILTSATYLLASLYLLHHHAAPSVYSKIFVIRKNVWMTQFVIMTLKALLNRNCQRPPRQSSCIKESTVPIFRQGFGVAVTVVAFKRRDLALTECSGRLEVWKTRWHGNGDRSYWMERPTFGTTIDTMAQLIIKWVI